MSLSDQLTKSEVELKNLTRSAVILIDNSSFNRIWFRLTNYILNILIVMFGI